MKNILCFLLFFPSLIFAGTGFYVTVNNHTNIDAIIVNAGNDYWYCKDFCSTQIVPAKHNKTFYTEQKMFFNDQGIGIQGIDISYGKVHAHVEFWVNHVHNVKTNLKYAKLISSNNHDTVGVGTNSANVATGINVSGNEGHYGTVYVTLDLNW